MKKILKLEEFFMFALSIFLFGQLDFAWWWYPLLLLAPDLSMIGYLVSPQMGAVTYNVVHHKGLGVSLYVLGTLLANPPLQLAGVILFGHSSMDRVFGYGLKFPDAFEHTHLGMIGRG
ncbi:MAG: DUF4260 domain-containing protein [Anaerolineales bacterium]|nr:DUF4260 domain-containing protein [Anaerolineales bacterium]